MSHSDTGTARAEAWVSSMNVLPENVEHSEHEGSLPDGPGSSDQEASLPFSLLQSHHEDSRVSGENVPETSPRLNPLAAPFTPSRSIAHTHHTLVNTPNVRQPLQQNWRRRRFGRSDRSSSTQHSSASSELDRIDEAYHQRIRQAGALVQQTIQHLTSERDLSVAAGIEGAQELYIYRVTQAVQRLRADEDAARNGGRVFFEMAPRVYHHNGAIYQDDPEQSAGSMMPVYTGGEALAGSMLHVPRSSRSGEYTYGQVESRQQLE